MTQLPPTLSVYLAVFTLLFSPLLVAAKESEFPGRKIYASVNTMSLQTLKKRLADVTVVDVRSAYEFQTLHIKGAINIPVSSESFVSRVASLHAEKAADMVVYCNGKTCMKSYKAAMKIAAAGIPNVHAYDAGIMDWAKAYPQDAVLLGNVLGDANKLISKASFKKHLLSPTAFGERVAGSNAYVLDVRDSFQRDSLGLFPGRDRWVNLDDTKKLDRYIRKAMRDNRDLLIYDAAGKQVRWLQYYLESKGIKNYYFMAGGARAYYKELTDEFLGRTPGS